MFTGGATTVSLDEGSYVFSEDLTTKPGWDQTGATGCTFTVTRFTRYKLGEGIEKRSEDFAAEVASYIKQ